MLVPLGIVGVCVLIGIGFLVGRISVTAQQHITRLRQERHRWLLRNRQHDLESSEGRCSRCRTL